jgi:hypothetical protein
MLRSLFRPFGRALNKTTKRRPGGLLPTAAGLNFSFSGHAGLPPITPARPGLPPITPARPGLLYGNQQSRPFTSGKSQRGLPSFEELLKKFAYESSGSLNLPEGDFWISNFCLPNQINIYGEIVDIRERCVKEIFSKICSLFYVNEKGEIQGQVPTGMVEELIRANCGYADGSVGSGPIDGIEIGLDLSGNVNSIICVDPKAMSVAPGGAGTTVLNISSGKNGYRLPLNFAGIENAVKDDIGSNVYDKPLIVEKFAIFVEAKKIITNAIGVEIQEELQKLGLLNITSGFELNLYTYCLGYGNNIIKSQDNLVVPTYGRFKSNIQEKVKNKGTPQERIELTGELTFDVNNKALLTDKFRALTAYIYTLNNKPSSDILEVIRNKFPDRDVQVKVKTKRPNVKEYYIIISSVSPVEYHRDEFNVDPTTGQLVPNTARNAAAGLPNQSPYNYLSSPMVGGYKRRRTTHRKPRRARV